MYLKQNNSARVLPRLRGKGLVQQGFLKEGQPEQGTKVSRVCIGVELYFLYLTQHLFLIINIIHGRKNRKHRKTQRKQNHLQFQYTEMNMTNIWVIFLPFFSLIIYVQTWMRASVHTHHKHTQMEHGSVYPSLLFSRWLSGFLMVTFHYRHT